MPQLSSRVDEAGWRTPAADTLLDESLPAPHSETFRREQAAIIQQYLADQGAPGRILRVGAFPSHTFFVLRPGSRLRYGPQQTVTAEDIERLLPALQDKLGATELGLVPSLRLGLNDVGLLLRMDDHQELRLRDLLVMKRFRNAASYLALAAGLSIKQDLLVRELAALPHLLLFGDAAATAACLRSYLVNLVLLNSPADLRLGLVQLAAPAGEIPWSQDFVPLPHVLGRAVRGATGGWRLLNGLAIEHRRRQGRFSQVGVPDLDTYNRQAMSHAVERLPRLLIVLDGLLAADWRRMEERWLGLLTELLTKGQETGIHFFLAVHGDAEAALPEMLTVLELPHLIMRAATGAAQAVWEQAALPAAFVEALWQEHGQVIPFMLGMASASELDRVTTYWRHNAVARAAGIGMAQVEPFTTDELLTEPEAAAGLPSMGALLRAAKALMPRGTRIAQAKALASYLGWLSVDPLHDVFGLTREEAERVIERLREEGFLEPGDGTTWRVVRQQEDVARSG